MKPSGSLQYFNNSILQINNSIDLGYLNGTNKSALCFKCTYNCGYCKSNFINEVEKCMNPHSEYITYHLFHRIILTKT